MGAALAGLFSSSQLSEPFCWILLVASGFWTVSCSPISLFVDFEFELNKNWLKFVIPGVLARVFPAFIMGVVRRLASETRSVSTMNVVSSSVAVSLAGLSTSRESLVAGSPRTFFVLLRAFLLASAAILALIRASWTFPLLLEVEVLPSSWSFPLPASLPFSLESPKSDLRRFGAS